MLKQSSRLPSVEDNGVRTTFLGWRTTFTNEGVLLPEGGSPPWQLTLLGLCVAARASLHHF